MNTIFRCILAVVVSAFTITVHAEQKKYILPNPDYNKQTPSPACIDGTITGVVNNKLAISGVNSAGKKILVNVVVSEKTSLFSVYGGLVFPHSLQKGIKLKVWYVGESCDKPIQPITGARVMIASEKPGDDWPK